MIPRKLATASVTVVLLAGAAGCGGSTSHPTASKLPAQAGSVTTSTSPAGSGSTASTGSTAPRTTAAGTSGGSTDPFCKRSTGFNPASPGQAEPNAAKLKADLQAGLAAAPSDIKPDFQKIADVEIPILDGKVARGEIEQRLADPRLETALKHIAAWSVSHCRPQG